MTDYERVYNEFWREIAENPDGTLNRDQVMRELHDFRTVMQEVTKVYAEITVGRFSKPDTMAEHIIDCVNELYDLRGNP